MDNYNQCIADGDPRSTRKRSVSPETRDAPLAREQSDNIIHEVEAARAQIYHSPGKNCLAGLTGMFAIRLSPHQSALVDENYIVVRGHIDVQTQDKIKRGEYVDFSRLLLMGKADGG